MSGGAAAPRILSSLVLADANVLYSRVLRDYLLYAMAHRLIRVAWSSEILGEVVEHLSANIETFDRPAGQRLVAAMNRTFPHSLVHVTREAWDAVMGFEVTDADDRHVMAAAVSVEATHLCSDDRTGFPARVMASLGIELVTSDRLLSALVGEAPEEMLGVHRAAVAGLTGATDRSTLTALRAAKASRTAALMEDLLGHRA